MPYPDKLLVQDEQVVERLHPHKITLVFPVLAFIVVCALSGVGLAFLHGKIWLIVVLVVALILIFWLVIPAFARWVTTHYVITTHRVLIRRGVLSHTGKDILLPRISDVSYRQTLWERIIGAGTLTIESAGEFGQETLGNIPRAERIQQTINRLIEEETMGRAAGPGMGYGTGALPQTGQQPAGQYRPPSGPLPPGAPTRHYTDPPRQ